MSSYESEGNIVYFGNRLPQNLTEIIGNVSSYSRMSDLQEHLEHHPSSILLVDLNRSEGRELLDDRPTGARSIGIGTRSYENKRPYPTVEASDLNRLVQLLEMAREPRPRVITFYGPSASGKTQTARKAAKEMGVHTLPKYSTRSERPGECNGDVMCFPRKAGESPAKHRRRFQKEFKSKSAFFSQYERRRGNPYYAILQDDLDGRLAEGIVVSAMADPYNAEAYHKALRDVRVWLYASPEELTARLTTQRGEAPDTQERLQRVLDHYNHFLELAEEGFFDFVMNISSNVTYDRDNKYGLRETIDQFVKQRVKPLLEQFSGISQARPWWVSANENYFNQLQARLFNEGQGRRVSHFTPENLQGAEVHLERDSFLKPYIERHGLTMATLRNVLPLKVHQVVDTESTRTILFAAGSTAHERARQHHLLEEVLASYKFFPSGIIKRRPEARTSVSEELRCRSVSGEGIIDSCLSYGLDDAYFLGLPTREIVRLQIGFAHPNTRVEALDLNSGFGYPPRRGASGRITARSINGIGTLVGLAYPFFFQG